MTQIVAGSESSKATTAMMIQKQVFEPNSEYLAADDQALVHSHLSNGELR